eukprot:CAMPEP_0204908824 /NCGR_PEP_ID=MMETSP1397-20131031/7697_1 /ASSEMBLY_ACC=CAM_ASM_000891 /TAXON_ID=49980 /ORGANISM="Climacostomum Climacostomum virens, Strain Stock W-24" /LENGTH=105 /DNA_ID=CAMNT_0052078485 /DNA_START=424 /DNA_END=740 /DNA_ORIENTATION=-
MIPDIAEKSVLVVIAYTVRAIVIDKVMIDAIKTEVGVVECAHAGDDEAFADSEDGEQDVVSRDFASHFLATQKRDHSTHIDQEGKKDDAEVFSDKFLEGGAEDAY